jgi:dynein heavy chain
MYLQPIFDSADISKQLPAESKKFKLVDQSWRTTMLFTKQNLNVIKVCSGEGLLARLKEGNEHLDVI